VYVRSFPNVDSTRVSISVDGGWAPLWAHTGDAIFYVNDAGDMVLARVEAEPRLRVLATEVLFRLDGDLLVPTQQEDGFYDVALDDQCLPYGEMVAHQRAFQVARGAALHREASGDGARLRASLAGPLAPIPSAEGVENSWMR